MAGGVASNAIGYAEFYSRSHDAVIRVFDDRIILWIALP